jgi:hypothetical protein
MPNHFDQFDESASAQVNAFDRFDAPLSQQSPKNKVGTGAAPETVASVTSQYG